METNTENPTQSQINSPDLPDHDDLLAELENLRQSYHTLQSKSVAMEENSVLLQRQNDEAAKQNADLAKAVSELSEERDSLREKVNGFGVLLEDKEEELAEKIDKVVKEKEELENEAEASREKIEKLGNERESLCDKIKAFEVILEEKEVEFGKKISEVMRQKDELKNEAEVSREKIEKLEDLMKERDSLREKIKGFEVLLEEKEVEFAKKIEELKSQVEVSREKVEKLEIEKEKKNGSLLKYLESIRLAKECLTRVIESVDEEKVNDSVEEIEKKNVELELDEELRVVSEEITVVTRLATEAEMKVNEYKEARKKEKRELDNSVVSLTEENRDINSLLRIALVEKEAVEKSLSRLKGNSEQKRVALLQIAERGLQRVGFGFMMGSGSSEQMVDSSGANTGSKSDSSECEEEVVSLASTVEKIMKNLRLEITQLRRSLEESRSDTERLQSLTEKQAQTIAENKLYIKELEDRERVLAQNVEEFLMEIKETETEVARWREACELEVEAGKNEIEERDKVLAILKQELEKTKSSLDISNGKLKLKEELAAAAMAAQAAAERSLELADSRAAGLSERIEELMRQLEEAERRERNGRRVRHICWPWRTFKVNPANNTNNRVQNVRRMLPEMQALLHYSV